MWSWTSGARPRIRRRSGSRNDQLLASLTPLRAELLRGDRRVAYVAWLLAAQAGELDPDTSEPRAPHGLDASSASLAALTSFLRVDPDLLAAAAAAGVEDTGELDRFRSWVAWLPAPEQQRWLLRAVDNLDLVPPRPVRRATVTTGTVEIRWAAAPSSGSVNGRAGLGRATLRRRCGHGSRLPREVAAPAA
jgi:hypothetical protein